MSNRKKVLSDFYTNICDEDNRLIKDKHSQVEFITTTKYIDKYLKPGDKILEVGAGTGRYSLKYAEDGYEVNAIEYVNHNVKILKSKKLDIPPFCFASITGLTQSKKVFALDASMIWLLFPTQPTINKLLTALVKAT